MDKKLLGVILVYAIEELKLGDHDLKNGRDFALGFVTGDIYLQRDLIEYLAIPRDVFVRGEKIRVEFFRKMKKPFIRVKLKEKKNG